MKQGESSNVIIKRGESLKLVFGALSHDTDGVEMEAEYIEFEKIQKERP